MPLSEVDQARVALYRKHLRIVKAKRCADRGDILGWGKAVAPESYALPFCQEMHQYFIDIRADVFTDTLAPRYHAKTAIKCVLIPAYQAIHEPDLFRHYLNVQATDKKALAVNRTIRTFFEENEIIRALYGNLKGPRWTDEQFVLPNGVCFTAVSAGQSIRGLNYLSRRPDYILVDDLYNEEDINNAESTEKKNEWFRSTLYPARAQSRRTSIHLQGTAINDLDLMSQYSKLDGVTFRKFQAVKDWEKKIVLWPELNSFESLMRDMGIMGSHIFMREMQNDPRDAKTQIIKDAWIQEYDPDTLVFDNRFQYSGCVLGVDPSIGQKAESDYTGVVKFLKGRYTDGQGEYWYIEGIWEEHISLDKRIELLQRIQNMQPPNRPVTRAYIEGIAGFKDFVAEAKRRTNIPIEEVDHVKDKITTLETKSTHFENKRIFINKNIEKRLLDRWKYQMTTNHPKNDDLRDATLLPIPVGLTNSDPWAYAERLSEIQQEVSDEMLYGG